MFNFIILKPVSESKVDDVQFIIHLTGGIGEEQKLMVEGERWTLLTDGIAIDDELVVAVLHF